MCNGSPTANGHKTQAPVRFERLCNGRGRWPRTVRAKANGFILVWESLTGIISVPLTGICYNAPCKQKAPTWHIASALGFSDFAATAQCNAGITVGSFLAPLL
jgi:hypothetical protein